MRHSSVKIYGVPTCEAILGGKHRGESDTDLAQKEELSLVRELRHKCKNPNSQYDGLHALYDKGTNKILQEFRVRVKNFSEEAERTIGSGGSICPRLRITHTAEQGVRKSCQPHPVCVHPPSPSDTHTGEGDISKESSSSKKINK